MADKIVLAFTISTKGTIFTPAQAAAKLSAVPLYANRQTDPVLGQFFGLTVADDVTAATASGATRTLTLNMTSAVRAPFAPPPFPCHPVGPIPPPPPIPPILDGELQNVVPQHAPPPNPPPQPPYALVDASTQKTIALAAGPAPGVFDSADVLVVFPPGVIVIEADVDTASDGTEPFPAGTTIVVGEPGNPSEFTPTPIDVSVAAIAKVFQATVPAGGKPIEATVSAPGGPPGLANIAVTFARTQSAKIVAIYSTSEQDTAGVPTLDTPIPPGAGAQSVSLSYLDSKGAGPFTVVTPLLGKFPAVVALAGGSVDVAIVTDMHIVATGGFKNSLGQITLAEMTKLPKPIHPHSPPFPKQQDDAQLLLGRALVYLPPSFFAVVEPQAAFPQLKGDFFVTTGQKVVITSEDQTAELHPGDTVRFAAHQLLTFPDATLPVDYEVESVTFSPAGTGQTGLLTLKTPYKGYDKNKYDSDNEPRPTNQTAHAQRQQTGAFRITPSPAAPPSDAALKVPLGETPFTSGKAKPPPPPPNPVVLSDVFARTLSLALAAPVVPQPIVLV